MLETNFWGSVRTIRAALPAMRTKGDAVIINVTSVSGRVPGTGYDGWYGASKWALNTLGEALVMELQGFGVRVACIEPGFFATEIMNNVKQREPQDGDQYESDYAWITRYHEQSVAGGGGDPVEVADVIVRAAYDPATPLHNLVGEGAEEDVDSARRTGSFEAWLPGLSSGIESVAGPRPVR